MKRWTPRVVNYPAVDVVRLQQEVDQIAWFHQIDLGGGVVTPGSDATAEKLATIGLPEDLTGRSVLDIGAWDGAFSFEAERRGAKRVLATDSYIWQGRNWGSKAGFEFARSALGSRVEDRLLDVMDLDPADVGTFDVVLFLGVLYHLRDPWAGLARVASVTAPGGLVVVETHVDMLHVARPAVALYPGLELNGDGSNWCGPNPAAVVALCEMSGFASAAVHGAAPGVAEGDPEVVTNARLVVHARK
jgi:tRNA (mo5U34)-methyltransferase